MRVITKKIVFIVIILVAFVTVCYFYYIHENQKQELVFFDVGQGDSIFINLPGNNEILIDGGPDNSVLYKLGKFMPLYDRSLELMVLTHRHEDHLFGLIEVLKRYSVKQILIRCELDGQNLVGAYQEFLNLANQEKSKIFCAENIIDFDLGGARLNLIYPLKNCALCAADPGGNNSSLVFRLNIDDGKKILFTGDIEEKAEREILAGNEFIELQSDILKVPHHGSETSLTEEFLSKISPKKAIISVGAANKFGHPSLRILKRLERQGAKILRTDEMGDVIIKGN